MSSFLALPFPRFCSRWEPGPSWARATGHSLWGHVNDEKWKWQLLRRVRLFVTPWTIAYQAVLCPWTSPGKNAGWWEGWAPYYRLPQDSAYRSRWGCLVQDFSYKNIWPSGSMKSRACPVCRGALTQGGVSFPAWCKVTVRATGPAMASALIPGGAPSWAPPASTPTLLQPCPLCLPPPSRLPSCPLSFFHLQLPHPCFMFFSHFWCNFIFFSSCKFVS